MSPTEVVPPATPPPDDDGEVGDWMAKKFGRSWRTRFVAGAALCCTVVSSCAAGGVIPTQAGVVAGAVLGGLVTVGMWHAADDKALGPRKAAP